MLPLLTYVELALDRFLDSGNWQHLQELTALQDLRLSSVQPHAVQASVLSGLLLLTRLEVMSPRAITEDSYDPSTFEPGVLDGKTQLQHLKLSDWSIAGGSAGISQLLCYLQQLKQLTCLDLEGGLYGEGPFPPAAAYSALTASSKLQRLCLVYITVPADVWQHVFPSDGKQLPNLRSLVIMNIKLASGADATAPKASSLVSRCPRLQSLHIRNVCTSAELLAPLTGLSSLSDLELCAGVTPDPLNPDPRWAPYAGLEGLEVVCQLTQLRRLTVHDISLDVQLLPQLTQLQQLTHLEYSRQDVVRFGVTGYIHEGRGTSRKSVTEVSSQHAHVNHRVDIACVLLRGVHGL
jgi:hypothetical protein